MKNHCFRIFFGTSGAVVVLPVELNDKTMINVTSPSQFSKFFINFNHWESLRSNPPVATWSRKSPIFGEGL